VLPGLDLAVNITFIGVEGTSIIYTAVHVSNTQYVIQI